MYMYNILYIDIHIYIYMYVSYVFDPELLPRRLEKPAGGHSAAARRVMPRSPRSTHASRQKLGIGQTPTESCT